MKEKNLNIIIISFSGVIIVALSGLFYYYALKSAAISYTPPASNVPAITVIKPKPNAPTEITKAIYFQSPIDLSQTKKSGSCLAGSVAALREDAYRCTVQNQISDPCFATADKNLVYCQTSPLKTDAFLIKLTKPLPKVTLPSELQSDWAWFLQLKDGTICSPFTGARPAYSNSQIGYYGCASDDKTKQIVLFGALKPGTVWTATKATLVKNGAKWVIQSTEESKIETIWQ